MNLLIQFVADFEPVEVVSWLAGHMVQEVWLYWDW